MRQHNLSTTAKRVVMVWACVAKEDNDWVKKCMEYEVEVDKRKLGDCGKRLSGAWTEQGGCHGL